MAKVRNLMHGGVHHVNRTHTQASVMPEYSGPDLKGVAVESDMFRNLTFSECNSIDTLFHEQDHYVI